MRHLFILILIWSPAYLFAQNEWMLDSQDAFQSSFESGKPVLLVFSGSDWCKPCIKMEQEIFSTEAFQSFADSSLILLKADFPRSRKNRPSAELRTRNEHLAEQYNPEGSFPKVILISSEKEILFESGYIAGGPVTLMNMLRQYLHETP